MTMTPLITPRPLVQGDCVAIASPASIIDPAYVDGARDALQRLGLRVKIMPHALDRCGSMAGTQADRIDDMTRALTDDDVKAVICSRGGYGCVQLLEALDTLPLHRNPKWLVGFSDVSALHALMASKGIVSIHGSMAKALALRPAHDPANSRLLDLLRGKASPLSWNSPRGNMPGTASGPLLGGNLAVIQALIATPYSPMTQGAILFVEDICEPIYKINRIFYQLQLAGILNHLSGLVIGQFTDYRPDANHATVEDMLIPLLQSWHLNIPIAFNAPIGHVDYNQPILHNAPATLTVTPTTSTLTYTHH